MNRNRPIWFPLVRSYPSHAESMEGLSGPCERPLMAVTHAGETVLVWPKKPEGTGGLHLSLATAIEPPGKRTHELLVFAGSSEEPVGRLEIVCSDPYQIHTLELLPESCSGSGAFSMRLRLSEEGTVWFFAPDSNAGNGLEYHLPHLFDDSAPADPVLDRLASMASIQTFSWKEGCVLDALQAYLETGNHPQVEGVIRQHLDYFGFSSGELIYETPRSLRVRGILDTIETTLPFAVVARLAPNHPWVDLAMDFWSRLMADNGQVQDAEMISSEGAYTVAYPMTVIGRLRGKEEWIAIAENLLGETFARLVRSDGIYLRDFNGERRTHRNWARGLCWLLLGHVQTLKNQPKASTKTMRQLQFLAEFALKHQSEEGLWHCFVDETNVLPDTSGSAGIAAAFAMAAKGGFLPQEYLHSAQLCYHALKSYVTPEGFLSGCSQSNKGGEELQRSGYRVTLPYALGLIGLLEVAVVEQRPVS